MGSNCRECIFARGKDDGLVHSPGDKPGDAIFCTNIKYLNESGFEVDKDPEYGYGTLVYRIEVIEDEDTTCEAGKVEATPSTPSKKLKENENNERK